MIYPSTSHEWMWLWSSAAHSLHPCVGMIRGDFNSFSRPFVYLWHSLPDSHAQSGFGFHSLLSQELPLISVKDLFGKNILKRTQILVHLLERLSEALTYRIWAVLLGSPLGSVLRDFFFLLNSMHHIIIPVLRSDVPHNCSQEQWSLLVLFSSCSL